MDEVILVVSPVFLFFDDHIFSHTDYLFFVLRQKISSWQTWVSQRTDDPAHTRVRHGAAPAGMILWRGGFFAFVVVPTQYLSVQIETIDARVVFRTLRGRIRKGREGRDTLT